MTTDNKCWWLASQFLEDTDLDPKEHTAKLAKVIQSAIEDFIEDAERS